MKVLIANRNIDLIKSIVLRVRITPLNTTESYIWVSEKTYDILVTEIKVLGFNPSAMMIKKETLKRKSRWKL